MQARVKFHVLLTTYEMVGFEAGHLRSLEWETLVVDEGHRYDPLLQSWKIMPSNAVIFWLIACSKTEGVHRHLLVVHSNSTTLYQLSHKLSFAANAYGFSGFSSLRIVKSTWRSVLTTELSVMHTCPMCQTCHVRHLLLLY